MFPLLQLPDADPPIVASMYSSSCRFAQPLGCTGYSRTRRVLDLNSTPMLLATSKGKNFYSSCSSVPRIVNAPIHIVVNPSSTPAE